MPRPQLHSSTQLAATPVLARLLARLRARLWLDAWLWGLSSCLGAVALGCLFAFGADYWLRVPAWVRMLHCVLLFVLPAACLWRYLWRPLRRQPGARGLALLLERARPELHELYVTAVELQADRAVANSSQGDREQALRRRILERAEASAATDDLAGVLVERPVWLRAGLSASATLVAVAVLLLHPLEARIFFARLFGSDSAWPQRTLLSIEIPAAPEIARIEPPDDEHRDEIRVTLARGSDLPVLVRVTGEAPDEVALRFEGGGEARLSRVAPDQYRATLPACQEDLLFWAVGGDDQDRRPRVALRVLRPPDVARVAVQVEPPAYTRLPARLELDRDIRVPAGSRLTIYMQPDPPEATGRVRLLPEDRLLELSAARFPRLEPESGALQGSDATDPPAPACASFELLAQHAVRYRFELSDASGLRNPEPGLYAVDVMEDRPPRIELISPGRGEIETTPQGRIALRAVVEDDYAVTQVSWSLAASASVMGASSLAGAASPAETPEESQPAGPRPASSTGSLSLLELGLQPPAVATDASATRARRVVGQARLELAELLAPESGLQYELALSALDNREPAALEGRSSPVRVRVLPRDELIRRLQDDLARLRVATSALYELQRDKRARALDLLEALREARALEPGDELQLAAAQSGQRRVGSDAQSLLREMCQLTERALYARVDDKAGVLLERLDEAYSLAPEKGWHSEPWRALADAARDERLGAGGFAAHLVGSIALALEISEEHARSAEVELDLARVAGEAGKAHAALERAVKAQGLALARLEELLERLAEWDNFQSVLSLTRDILERQKSLRDRTRRSAAEK